MHIKTIALVFERKPRKISGHPGPCLGHLNIVGWEWTVHHIWYLLDLQPAPNVGFNLTFICPEGQVSNNSRSRTILIFSMATVDWIKRFLTTTGLRPLLSWQHVKPMAPSTPQTGQRFPASFVRSFSPHDHFSKSSFWNCFLFPATTTECFDCTTTSRFSW